MVQVSGPDAVSYLQGQLSQNVEPMGVGTTVWTLTLHPHGKVASWFRLTRTAADAFLADVDTGFGEALVTRLMRFKLRTKVEIASTPGWGVVAVRNQSSLDGVPVNVPLGVWSLPFEWNDWVGVDLLGPADLLDPLATNLESAGIPEQGPAWFEVGRLVARFPGLGSEIDDDTIPAEVGVVGESVSFTKGCYVGQELVARIDSRGAATPRRLRRIVVSGPAPPPGADLQIDGVTVGRLTSVAADPESGVVVALALVKRAVESPASATVAGTPGATAAILD